MLFYINTVRFICYRIMVHCPGLWHCKLVPHMSGKAVRFVVASLLIILLGCVGYLANNYKHQKHYKTFDIKHEQVRHR